MDKQEFKFPDEQAESKKEPEKIEVLVEEDTEIEVVDDTPEQDRNRAPMKEAPVDVTDEELASYSENAKKRIQHFSKGYHEERRAKEAALREKEEALRFAQVMAEENKKLKANVGQGQQALLEQAKRVVAQELESAKRQYKEAYEAGDSDALVAAQEALTSAKIKAEKVNNFKPALQNRETVVKPELQPPAPQIDPKVSAWREANPWFGDNKRMTAVALTIHQELVDDGVDTRTDEYFDRINAEMRQVFPYAFPSEKPVKRSTVVAPATRSTAPRRIVLTKSQENIAKRLGLTNQQYAREVVKEMRKQNG